MNAYNYTGYHPSLKMWGDAMTSILCADLKYHEIDKMEHEEDLDDISGEELLVKFKEIYNKIARKPMVFRPWDEWY